MVKKLQGIPWHPFTPLVENMRRLKSNRYSRAGTVRPQESSHPVVAGFAEAMFTDSLILPMFKRTQNYLHALENNVRVLCHKS